MARLRSFMNDHLQNNKESETELNTYENFYYFWSGNKYNHFTDNIQSEFCQVIKIDRDLQDISSVTMLKSLCDISEDYSSSLLATINETAEYFKDDLTNKVYQQSHQLKEAYGLCVKGMAPDHALTLSEIFDLSSSSVSLNADIDPYTSADEMIYTCQCDEGYGYENCTEVQATPINGVSAGNTYCMTEERVQLDATGGGTDERFIIFVDHVVYGRPKFWKADPLNIVSKIVKKILIQVH